MKSALDGNALVYCQGAFNTTNGKTAHGLVRFTKRYNVIGAIDSKYAGQDAGLVLDGKNNGIRIYGSIKEAVDKSANAGRIATHLVVGLAPDGGRLSKDAREDIKDAISLGLNIDCGLHDFLADDDEIARLAQQKNVLIRDIRKPVPLDKLHFFSGKIGQVDSLKIAVLGTDSAVGKRTTAGILVDALNKSGHSAEMIGTGQTSWMQGTQYCIIFDSLINDFVSGEIEHAVWSAWHEKRPEIIIIEGQGSLMNPAYPGGFEILAAGRPDAIILQHAPARKDYDGFPGYPIHPLPRQIEVIELLSGKPVVAIAINHEDLVQSDIPIICATIQRITGLPAFDVLQDGADGLIKTVLSCRRSD